MLKSETPQPLYQAIKSYVLNQIEMGEWKPGARIPSESEIGKIFKASRMTVNRSFRELVHDGLITRLQGVGSFVAEPRPQATLLNIRSIKDEISERNGVHSCEVVSQQTLEAPESVVHALEIKPGTQVFHVLLVHLENEQPVQIEDRYVNPNIAPEFFDQNFTELTPSDYLLSFLPVTEIEHNIESKLPNEMEFNLLQISPSEPCLILNRRSWSGRQVVTCVRLINPGLIYQVGGRFQPRK